MARSSKRLARVVEVFHDLETIERAKVAEIAREMDALRTTQHEIFESLAKPASFHGPFMALLSSRIGRIERRLQQLEREREAALKRFSDAAGRRKSAAELMEKARGEEGRKRESSELEALLEYQEAAQGRCKSPRST